MKADFDREVHALLGLPFDRVGLQDAVALIRKAAVERRPYFVSTPNLNFAMACRKDDSFRSSVAGSDLSIADGMPIVWAARLLGVPIRERVAGSDVFELLRQASQTPLAVYFFGGPDGVARAACERLNAEHGGLFCTGCESPGFGSIEDISADPIIEKINGSHADFLVVALGARKGQAWIERNRNRLSPPVVCHLGAVVNFVAGTVARAPRWMQKSGLEWIWRIIEEPALAKRYFQDALALGHSLATEILPGMLLRLARAPELATSDEQIDVAIDNKATSIKMSGAWQVGNLGPVRSAFAGLAVDRDVMLDLGAVSDVDSALVGLLLLLEEQQRRAGARLRIVSPCPRVRRRFASFGTRRLLAHE